VSREWIADKGLVKAIARAERVLIDADLGGGLIKLRVARPGEGRSGGYRTRASRQPARIGAPADRMIACRHG
jgi:hypothetical protein